MEDELEFGGSFFGCRGRGSGSLMGGRAGLFEDSGYVWIVFDLLMGSSCAFAFGRRKGEKGGRSCDCCLEQSAFQEAHEGNLGGKREVGHAIVVTEKK